MHTYFMNRNHLALFRAVAEHGNITAASNALNISQPAVSAQVASLERDLGVKLFDRLPRGVRLTEVGRVLFDYAWRIGQLENEAAQAVKDHLGLRKGRLAIGASTSIGSYFLPKLMGTYAQRHPGVQLSLIIANTEDIQRDLADGTLDIGLTEGFASADDFKIEVFREDELRLIAPADHPLAGRKTVTLDELLEWPLLAREPGSGTRAVLERELARRDVRFEPAMALGSTEALKRAVAAGLGLAWISELTLGLELKSGHLVTLNIENFTIRRPLHRLLPLGRTTSAAVQAFETILKAQT